jgi:hypothetical protein
MQQQQESEPRGDVGAGRNERGHHDVDERSVDARKYVGSRGIDASGINTCVAGRRQGHVDLLERIHWWRRTNVCRVGKGVQRHPPEHSGEHGGAAVGHDCPEAADCVEDRFGA